MRATVEQQAPAFPIFTIDLTAHHYPFAYSDTIASIGARC